MMKRPLLTTACAAALSSAFFVTGPLLAQGDMRADVAAQLQRQGMEVPTLDELNDAQLRQIGATLRTAETDREMREQIESIAAADVPCLANDSLRQSVEDELQTLGVTDVDVSALSGQEVVELHLILSCDECSQEQRVRSVIERTDGERVGDEQLRAEVGSCLQRMNVDTANLDALTPQELAEIELIVGGGGSQAEMRQQVQQIVSQ
jgi:hypothetical protein